MRTMTTTMTMMTTGEHFWRRFLFDEALPKWCSFAKTWHEPIPSFIWYLLSICAIPVQGILSQARTQFISSVCDNFIFFGYCSCAGIWEEISMFLLEYTTFTALWRGQRVKDVHFTSTVGPDRVWHDAHWSMPGFCIAGFGNLQQFLVVSCYFWCQASASRHWPKL